MLTKGEEVSAEIRCLRIREPGRVETITEERLAAADPHERAPTPSIPIAPVKVSLPGGIELEQFVDRGATNGQTDDAAEQSEIAFEAALREQSVGEPTLARIEECSGGRRQVSPDRAIQFDRSLRPGDPQEVEQPVMIEPAKGGALYFEKESLRRVDIDRYDPGWIVAQEVENVVTARGDRQHLVARLNRQGHAIAFGIFPGLGEHQAAAIGRVVRHVPAPRPTGPPN